MTELHLSPLDAIHRDLGAQLTEFGGWDMPLRYPLGTVGEHLACRRDAVVFDVSHLGTVRVEGEAALAALQAAFTNDLHRIGPGRAQYTHLLDPVDGSVVDDIIVWWVDQQRFDVMPNASNTTGVRDALAIGPDTDSAAADVTATDVTADRAVLAVQGPQARAKLANILPELNTIGRFQVGRMHWEGTEIVIAGTGYTGEDGIEIAVPCARAADLWAALLAAGITPAGLGARDTLRLEAGLPLHGHELGSGITPFQANLGWVVRFDKGDFRGAAALQAEADAGVTRILRGIATEGRRPLREHQAVYLDGAQVGITTSGNFSPILEHGIALAFLPPSLPEGTPIEVEYRPGKRLDGTLVSLPFIGKNS